MKFEDCFTQNLLAGYILAHSLKTENITFKKGRILSEDDISKIRADALEKVTVAILEDDDLHEDNAADLLAEPIKSEHLEITASFTGRVNIVANTSGLLVLEPEDIIQFNMIDDAITIATLPNYSLVQPKQLLATIKIIPFSTTKDSVDKALKLVSSTFLKLHEFSTKNVSIIQTELPSLKASILDKTRNTLETRLHQLNATVIDEKRVSHDESAVKEALINISKNANLIILTGASAITDRRDVLPAALETAGGSIHHYGMPVDPGNLLLLGEYQKIPVIAMPGCARSPKLNGFDWVLQRICADIQITKQDFAKMAIGGLLKEIPSRPTPRQSVQSEKLSGKIANFEIILLAAGQSRRMGKRNKLLAEYKGRSLIDHALDCLSNTNIETIHLVVGHEQEKVISASSNYKVKIVENPEYESGIASSLKAGIQSLSNNCDAALICLSDMPLLSAKDIQKIFASFSTEDGREICIPTYQGKRGNPVLISKRFFPEIMDLTGDIGAKPIISSYPDFICEVPMNNDAILIDTDTPEALKSIENR